MQVASYMSVISLALLLHESHAGKAEDKYSKYIITWIMTCLSSKGLHQSTLLYTQ